jgi:hypothetical protein
MENLLACDLTGQAHCEQLSILRVPALLRDIGSRRVWKRCLDMHAKPAATCANFGSGTLAPEYPLAYRRLMRLKSSIWVAAYLRRCQTEGVFGAVRRRGAEEAGAVFVKVALLDGNAMLYMPAPQAVYDDSRPIERIFTPSSSAPVPEQSVEERLSREIRFDPDAWIVETEDRAGRHFLDLART